MRSTMASRSPQDAAQAATDTVKDSSVEHAQQLTDEAKQAASETASQARS